MSGKDAPSEWGPRWSRWVGRGLARGLWATTVRGKDNVPSEGAAIVVANHLGFIDGPVIHGVIPRGSHFLISDHMFTGPIGPLLKGASQIKVEGAGRTALAQGLAVLRRGGVVGVFPEGTRGAGSADSVHGGAAWLALQSGAPIVPTALIGTRHTGESVNVWPRPRRRILVEFGEPVVLEAPPELKGRAKQSWAESEVAAALRRQVTAALATTDLKLPTDTPERSRPQGGGSSAPKENA
ncbi:lysophospholipid acyltransferase family protein [Demequina aurantiaca]|uniref:lysophospholipid acyltransferase family protein n=1 Tax=Demequina aurantiaca TaxID=676200 RepID=UPI000785854C|nr:lysophospholipid acyltransferase family protein [Demequina aurantiaca]